MGVARGIAARPDIAGLFADCGGDALFGARIRTCEGLLQSAGVVAVVDAQAPQTPSGLFERGEDVGGVPIFRD
jgi:hypothetical protein